MLKDFSIKRLAGIILSVLGVLSALITLLYGIIHNTEESVEVKVQGGDSVFTTTGPGVLSLYPGIAPTISAKVPEDSELIWAIGRSDDVAAYLGESSYTQVEGLKSASEAKISTKSASPELNAKDVEAIKSGTLALDQSDLWEKAGREKNELKLEYSVPQGMQRAFIATTTTGVAPDIVLHWEVKATAFPTVQLVLLGVLFALFGTYLLFSDNRARARTAYYRDREMNRKAQQEQKAQEETEILPSFEGDLADPETDREIQRKHTEAAFGASILPGTSRTEALRGRELDDADRIVLPDFSEQETQQETDSAQFAAPQTAQKHTAQLEETDKALGAAIIAGTSRAKRYRSRRLSESDRIKLSALPADLDESTQTAEDTKVKDVDLDLKAESEVEGGAQTDIQDNQPLRDSEDAFELSDDSWKSLWDFAIDENSEQVDDLPFEKKNIQTQIDDDAEGGNKNHAS